MLRTIALTVTAVLAAATASRAQEAAAGQVRTFKDRTGKLSIALPAPFEVIRDEPGSLEDLKAPVIDVQGRPANWNGRLTLRVHAFGNHSPTLGGYVSSRFEVFRARKSPREKVTCTREPVPHVVREFEEKDVDPVVVAFALAHGYGFEIALQCVAADVSACRSLLPGLIESLRCTGPVWPERITKGRQEVEFDGIVLSHLSASKRVVQAHKACIQEVYKAFVADHGEIVRPEGEVLVVYVHDTANEHRQLVEMQDEWEVYWLPGHRWLFTTPFQRHERNHVQLVYSLFGVFLEERYGDERPNWFYDGERQLAVCRDEVGRGLPAVPASLHDELWRFRMPLAGLQKLTRVRNNTVTEEQFVHGSVYVALFRKGPRKYRDAYQRFLEEFARTGDGDAAAAKHLYSLDQDELLAEAKKFIKKLRVAKAKKRP